MTNRQAHEEAAGMGLCAEFFKVSGIDPDAECVEPENCPRCGKAEAHFVPPSLGEAGFFICDEDLDRFDTRAGEIDELLKPHAGKEQG